MDKLEIGLTIFGLFFAVVALVFTIFQDTSNKEACKNAGGIWIYNRDTSLCLDPSVIKSLK